MGDADDGCNPLVAVGGRGVVPAGGKLSGVGGTRLVVGKRKFPLKGPVPLGGKARFEATGSSPVVGTRLVVGKRKFLLRRPEPGLLCVGEALKLWLGRCTTLGVRLGGKEPSA